MYLMLRHADGLSLRMVDGRYDPPSLENSVHSAGGTSPQPSLIHSGEQAVTISHQILKTVIDRGRVIC